MYSGETDGSFGRAKIKILKKVGTGYQPLQEGNVTKRNKDCFLFNTMRGYTLTAPGVYLVRKEATAKSVGVYQD